MNKIYDLKLHETVIIDSGGNDIDGYRITAMRVPNGWIYTTKRNKLNATGVGISETSVFVPFDDEFKIGKREE